MPLNPSSLVDVLKRNKSKKVAATRIIESSSQNAPILSKLTQSKTSNLNPDNASSTTINKALFDSIYTRAVNLKQNSEYIIKLFPDIELVIQILVSSILSPKKMTDTQITYKLKDTFNLPSHVSSELLIKIEEHLNKHYNFEDKLPIIIRTALFDTGAYIQAVIPEASVDEVINRDIYSTLSTESFKETIDNVINEITKPLNIITPVSRPSELKSHLVKPQEFINHLTSDNYLRITDNFNLLKLSDFKEKIRKKVLQPALKKQVISTESREKLQYIDIFRTKSTTYPRPLEVIKTKDEAKRKSIGKPLYVRLNAEAVIPIISPGDETNHVGYFVLLDDNGQPLSATTDGNKYRTLNDVVSGSANSAQLSITQKAYKNLAYDNTDGVDMEQLYRLYSEMIEKQLYDTVKNSIYSSNVSIPSVNDVYLLMFARALNEQKTNILFLPKELLVYFTFYYNDIGMGKSLLENLSILSSLRAILLFARTMAYTKQSIDVTKVNISLDPNDPDPEKTIEQVQDSVLKLRQNYFPLGINNPVDLIDWIQRAGLQFAYDNHPGIPNVKIDFENANISHTIPSSELEDDLRKQTIISLGLSPETVDSGFSPEFATTVVNNNLLLTKRIVMYQKTLLRQLNKLVYTILYNDEEILGEMKTYLKTKLSEISSSITPELKVLLDKDEDQFFTEYLNTFVENIYLELPKPDNTSLTNLAAEYDEYKSNLEKVLDSIISTEVITTDLSGDIVNHIESIKNNYKHHLLRKWMSENNFYTEVFELVEKDKDSDTKTLDIITTHLSNVMANSTSLISMLEKFKLATNKDLEKLNAESSDIPVSSSSDAPSESGREDAGDIVSDDDLSLEL